jgi:hypothetical protein
LTTPASAPVAHADHVAESDLIAVRGSRWLPSLTARTPIMSPSRI